jgi:CheY-like chemotaxis protein
LKFTERGSVTVTAFAVDDGKSVRFQVADSGIGIANADLERIFDEFVQINSPLQSKVKGTGLGLPLSRRLAETLDGTLTVESVLGRGSTFTVTLPRIHAPAPREQTSDLATASAEPRVGRVLIVDDDEIERYALRQALALPADHVVEAADGVEGLRLARQAKPDLMFLDLTMPGMQGFDLLSEIRADAEMRNTPVIIFTSRDLDADDRRRLLAADAVVFKSALSREVVAQAMVQALSRVNA